MDVSADPERGVVAGDVGAAGRLAAPRRGLRPGDPHRGDRLHARRPGPGLARERARHPPRARRRARRRRRALPAPLVGHRLLVRLPRRRHRGPPGARRTACPTWTPRWRASRWCSRRHAAGEVACTIVRPGDVYGPGSRPWTILPVEEIARGRLRAAGDGPRRPQPGLRRQPRRRDRARRRRATRARARCSRSATASACHHAASSSATTGGCWAARCGWRPPASSVRWPARPRPPAARASESEVNAAGVDYLARGGTYSIEKARTVLGYEPAVDLEEGMRRTEEWLRAGGLRAR